MQRCFYLFIARLPLVIVAPRIEPTPQGRLALNGANLFVVVAAVATLGHTLHSFWIAQAASG